MTKENPVFPNQIWDGLTRNVDRIDDQAFVNPDAWDYERLAAEIISMQEFALNGGTVNSVTGDTDLSSVSGSATYLTDTSSANVTFTLPDPADFTNKRFTFKKTTGSNLLIIDAGTDTIDGQTTRQLSQQYSSLTIMSDGTEWFII